jgi:hypothetical protein
MRGRGALGAPLGGTGLGSSPTWGANVASYLIDSANRGASSDRTKHSLRAQKGLELLSGVSWPTVS